MGGEPRVAQWYESLISLHNANPKFIPSITKDEESRLIVDHSYPTNKSNYDKDALNIIKVDDIEYHLNTRIHPHDVPQDSTARNTKDQFYQLVPQMRHYLQSLLTKWDFQKIGYTQN